MGEGVKLIRAAAYVESLAKGLDPTTGCRVRSDDVVNNVEVTRCLFYVAEVLKRDAVRELRQRGKRPFYLSFEERRRFKYSDRPMSISEFTRRINELVDRDCMTLFGYERARDWLVRNGFLETAREGSHPHCIPTAQGRELGISMEERTVNGRDRLVVVYDREAQAFLIDNLDAILDKNK